MKHSVLDLSPVLIAMLENNDKHYDISYTLNWTSSKKNRCTAYPAVTKQNVQNVTKTYVWTFVRFTSFRSEEHDPWKKAWSKKSTDTAPLKWSNATHITYIFFHVCKNSIILPCFRDTLTSIRNELKGWIRIRNELKGRIRIWNRTFRIRFTWRWRCGEKPFSCPEDRIAPAGTRPGCSHRSSSPAKQNRSIKYNSAYLQYRSVILVHPSGNFVNYVLDKMSRWIRWNNWFVRAVPRNRKLSEFRSEPFRGREKCSEKVQWNKDRSKLSEFSSKPFRGREKWSEFRSV